MRLKNAIRDFMNKQLGSSAVSKLVCFCLLVHRPPHQWLDLEHQKHPQVVQSTRMRREVFVTSRAGNANPELWSCDCARHPKCCKHVGAQWRHLATEPVVAIPEFVMQMCKCWRIFGRMTPFNSEEFYGNSAITGSHNKEGVGAAA